MDKNIKLVKENWEVLVLAVTSLLAVVLLAVFFLGSESEENVASKSKQKLERAKALSDKAFAFLTPRSSECARNPFELPSGMLEPPKPKHTEPPKPKKEEPPTAVVQPAPEPKTEPTPEPPPEPKEKPKPKVMIPGTFEFVFQRCNNDGRTIALVKIQRQNAEVQGVTVGVGEAVMGVKVISISEDRIQLQDAKGNRGTIPLGEKRRVMYLSD